MKMVIEKNLIQLELEDEEFELFSSVGNYGGVVSLFEMIEAWFRNAGSLKKRTEEIIITQKVKALPKETQDKLLRGEL